MYHEFWFLDRFSVFCVLTNFNFSQTSWARFKIFEKLFNFGVSTVLLKFVKILGFDRFFIFVFLVNLRNLISGFFLISTDLEFLSFFYTSLKSWTVIFVWVFWDILTSKSTVKYLRFRNFLIFVLSIFSFLSIFTNFWQIFWHRSFRQIFWFFYRFRVFLSFDRFSIFRKPFEHVSRFLSNYLISWVLTRFSFLFFLWFWQILFRDSLIFWQIWCVCSQIFEFFTHLEILNNYICLGFLADFDFTVKFLSFLNFFKMLVLSISLIFEYFTNFWSISWLTFSSDILISWQILSFSCFDRFSILHEVLKHVSRFPRNYLIFKFLRDFDFWGQRKSLKLFYLFVFTFWYYRLF